MYDLDIITGPIGPVKREVAMQDKQQQTKACDFAGCNHCGPVETCGLNCLGVGCRGWVVSVFADSELRRRLLEMGFCNGAQVEVLRRAPLQVPIEFRLRGYCLAGHEEQAKYAQV